MYYYKNERSYILKLFTIFVKTFEAVTRSCQNCGITLILLWNCHAWHPVLRRAPISQLGDTQSPPVDAPISSHVDQRQTSRTYHTHDLRAADFFPKQIRDPTNADSFRTIFAIIYCQGNLHGLRENHCVIATVSAVR